MCMSDGTCTRVCLGINELFQVHKEVIGELALLISS